LLCAERDRAAPATRTTAFAVSPARGALSQRRQRDREDPSGPALPRAFAFVALQKRNETVSGREQQK
jgi:hypothetical protein